MKNKIKKWYLLFGSLIGVSLIGIAGVVTYSEKIINETALSYNKTFTVDLGGSGSNVDTLTMQAVWAPTVTSTGTFIDGRPSTATFAISNNYANLSAAYSGVSVKISSNNPSIIPASGIQLSLNGYNFSGPNFYDLNFASMSATNLKALIDATGAFTTSIAGSGSDIVYASSTIKGTFANSWTATTSSAAALTINGDTANNNLTFIGGLDAAKLTISTCSFVADTNFTVATSSSVTAKNLSDAIVASGSCLAGVVTSTWNGNGIVYATATTVGTSTAYSLYSSTPLIVSLNGSSTNSTDLMKNGADSAVLTSLDALYIPNHKFTTSMRVCLSTTVAGSVCPGTLAFGATYFAIPYDSNTVRLATTSAYAVAGTPYMGISSQTALGRGSFTLTPTPYAGTPTLNWLVSNDGVYFSTYTTMATGNYLNNGNILNPVSYGITTTTTTIFDFGNFNYRYIRAFVVAPTGGGLNLQVTANGKSNTK